MDILYQIWEAIRPAVQGIFYRGIPFDIRWRMFGHGIFNCLAIPMKCVPWLFSRAFNVHMIPNRHGQRLRCLVFQPPATPTKEQGALRPLHLSIHSGAFIGGIAEMSADWAVEVARRTGAVVVVSTYRFAPVNVFPAAHDDTDDVVAYLMDNSERLWGADPKLFTVSGMSAGGNLAMTISQKPKHRPGQAHSVKAGIMMWSPIDFRLRPEQKKVPPGFPTSDPLSWMMPLFDMYPGPVRAANMENYRLNPCLAPVDEMPEDMLFVIPTMDILAHEEFTAVERIKHDLGEDNERKVETCICQDQIHGFAELPDMAIDLSIKRMAYDTGFNFLRATHAKHGFTWSGEEQ